MAKVTIPTTGLWGVIAGYLNAMFTELYERTGWASYVDTEYTEGSPFVVPANTITALPNNAGNVIDHQKPGYITSFYDGAEILGRNGDSVGVQIYFDAVPTNNTQWAEVWIDIGGAVGVLYRMTESFPKGIGEPRGLLYPLPAAYNLGTWEGNGGTVYVRSSHDLSIYGINYNFVALSKAR